ncbi:MULTISPECIES: HAD hydrolase-like protein [Xanthomonas]|uniref:HAD hydrolase-like protein n=1 Tax=Xanthomonas TaxID=338 RepID=UPI001AD98E77|nr:HAD hydrolase-like protein [Xanthomonas phaseoli]MBO9768993.1 HAD hydrolase-like protein [Xanthomonas phaseoli pv. dieffenbachiae]MBO9774381.1 HAD hydrolase-like protein [Xanthomonas phaseoli pv. dieffenbachiae]MBO9780472.1 HAD hydrolase-like protein [Xanthomonas phaseoli pv. dieffenbachiae]MBO9795739.1 HAD hydrolase-like protein [Xanthomonas phaseoli pv. dieffenbachiae]MBO9798936.1 HAD hydrolase-like protein [Xanthomonas phaseoli pv. dieffenbachiae]
MPALIIFDFDGTLADSFGFFLSTQRLLAERHGFRAAQAHEVDDARRLSTRELLKASGLSAWRVPWVAADFIRLMRAAPPVALFPGIAHTVSALHAGGARLAVVSSNSVENVQRALGAELSARFAVIEGGAHLLGKQRALRRVLHATGHPASQAVYVGDQVADWEAAQVVGLPFAAVAWGYAHPDVFAGLAGTQLIARVEDLLALGTR